ncbi:MAG: hypothetical protein ACLU8V_06255 [Oscillospiraceae bacterium]
MLEKNRFLAIKNLAKDIRKENEKLFKAFAKETVDDAVREKEEFIESVVDSMDIAFSDGEQGKEERQIFRANLLIPDDLDFFNAYSKDKNIRNLMNKYAVGIEDIMSKITELNIYGKYIDIFSEEEEKKTEDDFVDEMVNLSSKEAESLLDEIEDLSSVMEELDIPTEETKEEADAALEPEVIEEETTEDEEVVSEESEEPALEMKDMEINDEFEDISNAVSGFVDEYTKVKDDLDIAEAKLKKFNAEKDELESQITALRDENEELKKSNLESADALNKAREEAKMISNENVTLKEQIKVMETKVRQSAELLKKIYNSIPKK